MTKRSSSDTKHTQSERAITIKPSTILMILGIGLVAYGLWQIKSIILVILVSVVIATFVYGGVNLFARFKIPRPLSVIVIYVLGFAFVVGAMYLFVPILVDELVALSELFPEGSRISQFFGSIGQGQFGTLLTQFQNAEPLEIVKQIRQEFATTNILQGLSALFGGIINFLLVIVISFYLSMQEHGVEQFLKIISPAKHEAYVIDVWQRSRIKIASWFKGQLLLAIINAGLTYMGLFAIGVPYALVLSLLALILSLVPFGVILATLPAVALAFLAGGVPMALFTIALYVLIQQIENYVLQPLIIKRVTGVPSLVVLLSVVIGAKLAGVLGVLLAIPVAVVILELVNDSEKHKLRQLEKQEQEVSY